MRQIRTSVLRHSLPFSARSPLLSASYRPFSCLQRPHLRSELHRLPARTRNPHLHLISARTMVWLPSPPPETTPPTPRRSQSSASRDSGKGKTRPAPALSRCAWKAAGPYDTYLPQHTHLPSHSRKKRVLVLCTGGTLTMSPDERGGLAPVEGALTEWMQEVSLRLYLLHHQIHKLNHTS